MSLAGSEPAKLAHVEASVLQTASSRFSQASFAQLICVSKTLSTRGVTFGQVQRGPTPIVIVSVFRPKIETVPN